MSKYTPWFPPETKPVRIGVYQRDYGCGEPVYSAWTGEDWLTWSTTAKGAARMEFESAFLKPWRGLSKKP